MDRYLTQLYMRFLCDALAEKDISFAGRGEMTYSARLHHTDNKNDFRSVLKVADISPRSLSFRLADIIKHHRERVWHLPTFIVPGEGEGVQLEDRIDLGSGVPIGALAQTTAAGIGIFLEKYLIRG